ncbi:MAG TPA: hypothetical protein VMV27_00815 [Candidatus Binataceae bacterium]|nr:hypothetical protein [Candidatus Binataceae bacterium]
MKPDRIYIIRDAEKPVDPANRGLSLSGYSRALLLARYLDRFYAPDFIFAAASSKENCRPELTMLPTAAHLNLPLNLDFADADFKKLARHLRKKKYDHKKVLICWHHGNIPVLVQALGVTHCAPIRENIFNRIWSLDLHFAVPILNVNEQPF